MKGLVFVASLVVAFIAGFSTGVDVCVWHLRRRARAAKVREMAGKR